MHSGEAILDLSHRVLGYFTKYNFERAQIEGIANTTREPGLELTIVCHLVDNENTHFGRACLLGDPASKTQITPEDVR